MSPEPWTIPAQFHAGDSLTWLESAGDYPAPTWQLKYHARRVDADGLGFDIESTAEGALHRVSLAPETTAAYLPGIYSVAVVAYQGAEGRATLRTTRCDVRPDLAEALADARSHARRMLAAIEAVLERRATHVQASYTIEGRALQFLSHEELYRARSRYRHEVAVEEGRAAPGTGRIVRVGLL
jgi:hypothetical protein